MEADEFDEGAFFRVLANSGAPDPRVARRAAKGAVVTAFVPPTPDEVRAIREEADRVLSLEEVRALDAIPLGEEELAENISLIDWFCRRYPTAEDRLRYARRTYKRWAAASPPAK